MLTLTFKTDGNPGDVSLAAAFVYNTGVGVDVFNDAGELVFSGRPEVHVPEVVVEEVAPEPTIVPDPVPEPSPLEPAIEPAPEVIAEPAPAVEPVADPTPPTE